MFFSITLFSDNTNFVYKKKTCFLGNFNKTPYSFCHPFIQLFDDLSFYLSLVIGFFTCQSSNGFPAFSKKRARGNLAQSDVETLSNHSNKAPLNSGASTTTDTTKLFLRILTKSLQFRFFKFFKKAG